jgi:hypothetical protein
MTPDKVFLDLTMLVPLLSLFIQKDRSQSLQSKLVAYLNAGDQLDPCRPDVLEALNQYEMLLVAVERKRYKFPLRWGDRMSLARYSRSAKNEAGGRSLRYNANYIELRNRCSRGSSVDVVTLDQSETF